MSVPLTDEQLTYDRVPIPFTPVKRLERGKLYVKKQTVPHPIHGYAQAHDEYSVVDLAGYKKGYEPRLELLGVYTPNPKDIFRLQNGHLPSYQPVTTGDKLQEAMASLPTFQAWRIAPDFSQEKSASTMEERFTIDCSYCGFLTSAKTLRDAFENARRIAERHKAADEKITIFDRLAQKGACQIYDIDGKCIKTKPFREEPQDFSQEKWPQTIRGFKVIEKGICPYCGKGYAKGEYIARWSYDRGPKHIRGRGVHIYCAQQLEREYPPETEKQPATEPLSAADYWNLHLEHNALRSPPGGKGPDTTAGAFLAWHLEAAGDIIRELSKGQYASFNYIFEKFNRIKNHLTERDWTDPLSPKETEDLVKIREDIERMPADTELLRTIKTILLAIADRQPRQIEVNLEPLRRQLKEFRPATYEPKIITQYPTGAITITHGTATVTGRFQRKGEMQPGQVEPDIEVTVLQRGTEEELTAAMNEIEEELRAGVREVEDKKELEKVAPIVKIQPPAEKAKYPLVLSMEDYKRDWEPKGWKIIFIGPTATWRQEWGIWESIRDLVQNALDETEAYQWGYDDNGLWLTDKGKGVAVADFLLGPPKLKPDYARGRFGEGMKIASLALLRSGHAVRVETVGRELWMVFLEQEADGKVQSLAALWRPDGTRVGTKFHIIGYFDSSYEDRFVVNLPKSSIIARAPSIITKPVQRYNQIIQHEFPDGNRIYARDIFMRPINSLFSYNLWGFDMSPDRFGPRTEDDVWNDMGRLWACVKDVKLLELFFQMKGDPPMIKTDETYKLDMFDYQMGNNPETNENYRAEVGKNKSAWLQAWKNTFGEEAVIRTNADWDAIIKHLGYKSVGLAYGISKILMDAIPWDRQIIDQSQERLREVKVVPDNQLSDSQIAHLALARAIAGRAVLTVPVGGVRAALIPPASDRVRTAGMYGRTTREIFIHVEQLFRGRSTVDTVIHEIAHHTSGAEDGEEKHNHEMTRVAGVVVSLAAGRAFDDLVQAPGFQW